MIEIDLAGQRYRIERMDAMTQFHVSRKLAPVLPTILPIISAMGGGAMEKAMNGDAKDLAEAAMPFAEAIAGMSDENAAYVVGSCLATVKRMHMDAWRPVQQNGQYMFDDMDMSVILPLVFRILREALGGFIAGLATNATPQSPE